MSNATTAGDALTNHARNLAEALRTSARTRSNEQELREDVHQIIVDAIGDLYGMDALATRGEQQAGSSGRRYDRSYGGLVIEWEWDMDASRRRHGADQALDYLANLRSGVEDADAFTAVVCDGRQFGFLVDDPVGQLSLDQNADALSSEERFEWRPVNAASARRFLELVGSNRKRPVNARALANEFGPGSETTRRAITLLTEALAGRHTQDRIDTLYDEWFRSIEVVYEDLDALDGALTDALRGAYEFQIQRPLGELLFSVHTYFALIARLIAIEVLGLSKGERDAQPSLWVSESDQLLVERLRMVDEGQVPSTLHVQNLFEGDVFSWYLGTLSGNSDLLNTIRDVLSSIGDFAFPRLAFGANTASDVLRDLYQELLPRELRTALGEFLTPQWLAEACLERLTEKGAPLTSGRVLDPTCGTATFLMPVITRRLVALRSSSGNLTSARVQEVLDTVVGFDLNPVAVIAARVNVVIALGDLANVGEITLPIWRADSILIPDIPARQTQITGSRLDGREWLALDTSIDEPFPVPPVLANRSSMPILTRLLETAMAEDDRTISGSDFQASLDREFGPTSTNPIAEGRDWEDAREVAIELWERIRRLREEGRDGVWARIIENSFAPVFAGRFDVVVGNPPWLGWRKMPESWRAAGMRNWKRYGMWRPPAQGGNRATANPQMGDVATLVYATAVDRYAADNAFIGMLVPHSLIIGDPSGRAFRKFHLAADDADIADVGEGPRVSFKAIHVDIWSEVKPFAPDASNSPIFLVTTKGSANEYPISASKWEKRRGERLGRTWPEARLGLLETTGECWPVDREIVTSQWSFVPEGTTMVQGGSNSWTFGTGLHTRGANGIYFVEVLSSRPDPDGQIEIANQPGMGRNAEVRRRVGRVESDLVYPLLRGRDVQRWLALPSGHIFAPYRQEEMGKGLGVEDFRDSFPNGYRWLRQFRPQLTQRRILASYNWDIEGEDWCQIRSVDYMDGSPAVAVNEMAQRPAAAVVVPGYDDKLGRTATTLVDHKLIFCAVGSEREAHYLAAMLNSEPVQNLLTSFHSAIGVAPTTLSRLPIPEFSNSAESNEIAGLARDAASAARADDPGRLAEVEDQINEKVLKMLVETAGPS